MEIKRRNMLVQVLLVIVTFGFYVIYWYYQTTRELQWRLKGKEEDVLLWTVFFCLPILHFLAWYRESELIEELTKGEINRWLAFVLWIFFPPAIWLIVQPRLNKLAEGGATGSGLPATT